MTEELYVLTTFYRAKGGFAAPIMHAYGPWPKSTCERERRRSLAEHAELSLSGQFYASVCKVLDVKS